MDGAVGEIERRRGTVEVIVRVESQSRKRRVDVRIAVGGTDAGAAG